MPGTRWYTVSDGLNAYGAALFFQFFSLHLPEV